MNIKVELAPHPRLLATEPGDVVGGQPIVYTVAGGPHAILHVPDDWSPAQVDAWARQLQAQDLLRDDGNGLKAMKPRGMERQKVSGVSNVGGSKHGNRDPDAEPENRCRGPVAKRENECPALTRGGAEEETEHEDEEADEDSKRGEKEDAADRLVQRARDPAEPGIEAAEDLDGLDSVAVQGEPDESPPPSSKASRREGRDLRDEGQSQQVDADGDVEARGLVEVSFGLHNDAMKSHADDTYGAERETEHPRPEERALVRVEPQESPQAYAPKSWILAR